MKHNLVFLVIFAAIITNSICSNQTEQIEVVEQTKEAENVQQTQLPDKPQPAEEDAFLLEIKYLNEQIKLSEKKIQLIEQLRSYYLENNQTIPSIALETLNQISIESMYPSMIYSAQPSFYASPIDEGGYREYSKEKSEMNFMNKIFKKYTLNLDHGIKEMMYLPTKSIQRTSDEPATTALIVFLTVKDEIHLYNINGQHLLSFDTGHFVKNVAVNTFTDEYFVATLGTDNTIRLFNITINRVKKDPPPADPSDKATKKVERPKFVLEYNHTLDYIYDLEANRVITEQELQDSLLDRQDKGYRSISAILGRSNKFLALSDENGALVLLNRNGTYKGKFIFPDSKLLTIQKFFPNPIYATEKTVGFFNPNMMEITTPNCDLPGERILKLELDQFSTSNFFVLLESGDVLFYELKQSGSHCKVVAKRSIQPVENKDASNFDIFSAKSFLLMQNNKQGANILAHNITDVVYASLDDIQYHNVSLYPIKSDQEHVSKSDYMTYRSSFSSSLIGTYFQFNNGTSLFSMYEITITQKPQNDWLSNFRLPIVFIAVLLAIGYQFWNRKKKKDDEEVMETLNKFNLQEGLAGKRMGGKNIGSLKESLDSLTKQTGKIQEDLDNFSSKAMSQIGSRKFKGGYDDDIQEISTKKYI